MSEPRPDADFEEMRDSGYVEARPPVFRRPMSAPTSGSTPRPWQGSRFVDNPRYRSMGPEWKADRQAEEALIVRGPGRVGSGECNPVARTFDLADAALIVYAVNHIEQAEAALAEALTAEQFYQIWWKDRWITRGMGEDNPPSWDKVSHAEQRAWGAVARAALAAHGAGEGQE